MYARHFGLLEDPFSLAPDPRFLYVGERHREALAHLAFGLQGAGGFVVLTGEVGAGKTTVCRAFLDQLPVHCRVAWIFNPPRDEDELLQAVMQEFGLAATDGGRRDRLDAINRDLLAQHAEGRQCVLVVDEAQALPPAVMESLRLLTNLETAERKLLQIVLVGQPELRDQLDEPGRLQVAQRVVARYHLDGLDPPECTAYLRHRLAVAGRQGELPFDDAAVRRLQRASGGVPRRLNLLAGRALLGAWAQGRARAGAAEVRQAEKELPLADRRAVARTGAPGSSRSPVRTLAVVSLALGLLGGLALGGVAALWPGRNEPAQHAMAGKTSAPTGASAASDLQPSTSASTEGSASAPDALSPAAAPAWPARPAARDTQWARLAQEWGVTLPDVEPCTAGEMHGLSCHRSPALTLATVRALDRPGLVTLVPTQGDAVTARLRGLSDTHAFLDFDAAADAPEGLGGAAPSPDASMQAWHLPVFAAAWRGDFSTWWRRSEALPDGREARAAAVAAAQLGTDPSTLDGPLRTAAVQAFQRAHGLVADGVPGTLTLMQWNRATGVDEPRLLRIGEATLGSAPRPRAAAAVRASQPAATP